MIIEIPLPWPLVNKSWLWLVLCSGEIKLNRKEEEKGVKPRVGGGGGGGCYPPGGEGL